jgi:hypothetical protein
MDSFERRAVLRAIENLIALLDPELVETDWRCTHHALLTFRPHQCQECRLDILDARADIPRNRKGE